MIGRELTDVRALQRVQELLAEDRAQHFTSRETEAYLGLSEKGRARLELLLSGELEAELSKAVGVLGQVDAIEQELEAVDRQLAAVPDAEAIALITSQRHAAQEQCRELEAELALATADVELRKRELEAVERSLGSMLQSAKLAELDSNDASRIMRHSERARETLSSFRIALTRQHAGRLEREILSGYQQLLRKQSLVARISIDPMDCRLSLLDAEERLLPPERLSAGERQLLAIAMLWGLARASGRVLPVIVDTPLGRLDAGHRTHLVERYFPKASHQVILLSTDEEIHGQYYSMLKPAIGHCYRLVYDDALGGTVAEGGYFAEGQADVH